MKLSARPSACAGGLYMISEMITGVDLLEGLSCRRSAVTGVLMVEYMAGALLPPGGAKSGDCPKLSCVAAT